MALFDSIISGASEKFGLGDKAGTILSALLALMTKQETGGFSGFLARFKEAGLEDVATSWITSGDNAEVSDEQIKSAIGEDTIKTMAKEIGVDSDKATSALAFMTPKVVDTLTAEGKIPNDEALTSKVSSFLTGIGGKATAAAAGVSGMAGSLSSGSDDGDEGLISGAADKISDTANDAVDTAKDVASAAKDKAGDAAEAVGDTAGAAVDKGKEVVGDAFESVGDVFDGDGDGGNIMKWLLPLLLLGILLVLGFMFCSNGNTGTVGDDTNKAKTNKGDEKAGGDKTEAVDSSVSLVAKDGKYSISGVVKDEETKNQILKEAEANFGAGNVDVSGLKVDANAKPLKDGWFDGFKGLLPDLKGWKDGAISWAGGAITTAGDIPGAVGDKIKSLFGGWSLGSGDDGAQGGDKELTEVTLSDGTKLQAFPGGIEDQLVKFIGSDEYKNATDEDLKNKWFDFDDLNFKFGTTELEAESKRQLDNVVAILKANPDVKIKIGGYTDKKGSDAANKKLSDTRAKAVKAALEKAGVGAQVPEAEGYGEAMAKIDESASDEERASDRKTSVRLLKGDEKSAENADEKPADDAEKKE